MQRKLVPGHCARVLCIFLLLMLLFSDMQVFAVANEFSLKYGGKTYQLKPELTTILLAGVDHYSYDKIYSVQHRNGGQADFLLLLVLDAESKTITPIQIDRDTMTEITTLNMMGRVSGSRTAQICLAHSFGDGAQRSGELLCQAVSNCMAGVPVDYYFTLRLDGIAAFNDALGGIEVTLKEDFSQYDSRMTAGKTMVLQGEQARIFIQERFYVGEETNASRQQRQWAYLYAAKDALLEKLSENVLFIGELLDLLEQYMVTNMGAVELLSHAAKAMNYEILPIQNIEGVHQTGENGFVEFIPDEEEKMELILHTFCNPVNISN